MYPREPRTLADKIAEQNTTNAVHGDWVKTIVRDIEESQAREDKLKPLKDHLNDRDIISERDVDAFAQKLLEKCYFKIDEMCVTNEVLLYRGKPLEDSPETIRQLANTPRTVPKSTAKWICDNLKTLAPKTDDTKMEIAKGLVWDSRTVRFTKGDPDEQAN